MLNAVHTLSQLLKTFYQIWINSFHEWQDENLVDGLTIVWTDTDIALSKERKRVLEIIVRLCYVGGGP
jgi:hypothetical protein